MQDVCTRQVHPFVLAPPGVKFRKFVFTSFSGASTFAAIYFVPVQPRKYTHMARSDALYYVYTRYSVWSKKLSRANRFCANRNQQHAILYGGQMGTPVQPTEFDSFSRRTLPRRNNVGHQIILVSISFSRSSLSLSVCPHFFLPAFFILCERFLRYVSFMLFRLPGSSWATLNRRPAVKGGSVPFTFNNFPAYPSRFYLTG